MRAVRVAFVLVVLATSAMAARVDTERTGRPSVGVTTLTMVDPGRRGFARILTARDAEREGADVALTARPR